jgi:hypothetical protein
MVRASERRSSAPDALSSAAVSGAAVGTEVSAEGTVTSSNRGLRQRTGDDLAEGRGLVGTFSIFFFTYMCPCRARKVNKLQVFTHFLDLQRLYNTKRPN